MADLRRPMTEFAAMCRHEPKLLSLLTELIQVVPEEKFCANRVWYGYDLTNGEKSPRERMQDLVGLRARNPALQSSQAYDLAYDILYGVLPDCFDGCEG